MNTGFIGGGNMAEALIKGMSGKGQWIKEGIIVSEPREERRLYLERSYAIKRSLHPAILSSSP